MLSMKHDAKTVADFVGDEFGEDLMRTVKHVRDHGSTYPERGCSLCIRYTSVTANRNNRPRAVDL